ncbi:hypothetical protein K0M31_010343 [Melipona bicolor]|uniref:Uncharacterized protein n=1 Tax=Melipona bicolor TaxID=60889 RepID=A0AA40FMT2_9HYME|nr:hypothetical protein K0M31_010343 [Melipona bicolor]
MAEERPGISQEAKREKEEEVEVDGWGDVGAARFFTVGVIRREAKTGKNEIPRDV